MTNSTELNSKPVVMIRPTDYGATDPTGAEVIEVDTQGYKWLTVIIGAGVLTGTSVNTIKLQESDTSGSGHTDITGAAFTTMTGAAGDDTAQMGVIDCHKHGRYIQFADPVLTAMTVTDFGAFGLLHSSEDPAFSQAAEFAV